MAAALLLAMWAVTASAARYGEYSDAKMPQYGGSDYDSGPEPPGRALTEDYGGRPIDASAPLDYKYEEDRREESGSSAEVNRVPEDNDMWPKFSRKHRSKDLPDNNRHEQSEIDDADMETVPKLKSSRRSIRNRSRQKYRSFVRKENDAKRRQAKYVLDKDDNDVERKVGGQHRIDRDSDIYKGRNSNEDDIGHHRRHVTEKVIRRKPRDRYVKSPPEIDMELEELAADRRTKSTGQDYEYKLEEDAKDSVESSVRPSKDILRPFLDEEDERAQPVATLRPQSKQKEKNYDDYGNYYDMKRVYNIKSKLPSLLRRSSVRTTSPTSTMLISQLEESLRRVLTLPEARQATSSKSTTTTTTKTTSEAATNTIASTTISSTTTGPPVKSSVGDIKKMEDLSLAEKSRLSILRKADKKEGLREGTQKKPPVLLQVTKKIVTIVVVEPGSSQRPWMRVREAEEDSPETIRKVKLLMRKKMVAGFRRMEEINEGWDEVVCDYVDMSLVKTSNGSAKRILKLKGIFVLFICLSAMLL